MTNTVIEHVQGLWGGERCPEPCWFMPENPLIHTVHGIAKQMLWAAGYGLHYTVVTFWDQKAGRIDTRGVNCVTGEFLS